MAKTSPKQKARPAKTHQLMLDVGRLNSDGFADWEKRFDIPSETSFALRTWDTERIAECQQIGGLQSAARYIITTLGPKLVSNAKHPKFTQEALNGLRAVLDKAIQEQRKEREKLRQLQGEKSIATSKDDAIKVQRAVHQLANYEARELEEWINSLKPWERAQFHASIATMSDDEAHQTLEDIALLGQDVNELTARNNLFSNRASARALINRQSTPLIVIAFNWLNQHDTILAQKIDTLMSHSSFSDEMRDELLANLQLLGSAETILLTLEGLSKSTLPSEFITKCRNRGLIQ